MDSVSVDSHRRNQEKGGKDGKDMEERQKRSNFECSRCLVNITGVDKITPFPTKNVTYKLMIIILMSIHEGESEIVKLSRQSNTKRIATACRPRCGVRRSST